MKICFKATKHSLLSKAEFLIAKNITITLPPSPTTKKVLIFKFVFLKLPRRFPQAITTSKVPHSRMGAITLAGVVLFLSHF